MKSKNFINKAKYVGGSNALKSFINDNLCYPKEALVNKIEGIVFMRYEVNEHGKVHNISVVNGLGYGCDEEAKRIVSLLKYPKVKNRGLKVNTKFKINIVFRLPSTPALKINYILKK